MSSMNKNKLNKKKFLQKKLGEAVAARDQYLKKLMEYNRTHEYHPLPIAPIKYDTAIEESFSARDMKLQEYLELTGAFSSGGTLANPDYRVHSKVFEWATENDDFSLATSVLKQLVSGETSLNLIKRSAVKQFFENAKGGQLGLLAEYVKTRNIDVSDFDLEKLRQ